MNQRRLWADGSGAIGTAAGDTRTMPSFRIEAASGA